MREQTVRKMPVLLGILEANDRSCVRDVFFLSGNLLPVPLILSERETWEMGAVV
jgi:hypothetical protein